MAMYRPATVDDQAVLARRMRDRRRATEAAAIPGRTRTYQTTDKVAAAKSGSDAAQATASQALTTAEGAATDASTALSAATAAQAAADKAQSTADAKADATALSSTDSRVSALEGGATLPVGACVLMASKTAPGLTGTWSLVTGVKLPMTGSDATYYVYERTA